MVQGAWPWWWKPVTGSPGGLRWRTDTSEMLLALFLLRVSGWSHQFDEKWGCWDLCKRKSTNGPISRHTPQYDPQKHES